MSSISLKYSGGDSMPNIKPISDLRNYSEVLRDAAKDITETVKEKSAGAAKDIREKVAEETETKEK